MPAMKDGGDMAQDKAMIKKAFKQHDMQEHKGGKGTSLKLKKGGDCYATGGVVMGQGGYKDGGSVIPVNASKKGAEGYVNTKMNTAMKNVKTGATGEVKKGKAGYAKGGGVDGNVSTTPAGVTNTTTGGVRLGNAGGFKKGGATKKFADGGSVQDDGRAVKMPQGNKKPSSPVSINELSGTFKKGGKVKKMAGGGLFGGMLNAAGKAMPMMGGFFGKAPMPAAKPAPAPAPAKPSAPAPQGGGLFGKAPMQAVGTAGKIMGMPMRKSGGKVKKSDGGSC